MLKIALAAVLAAALPSVGFAGGAVTAAKATPAVVQIQNFHFLPQTLTITAGTTVIWRNEDDSPHTVTGKNRAFRSAALDTNDAFSHTFTTPGEFSYFCAIHPMMVGRIIVKPAGSSS